MACVSACVCRHRPSFSLKPQVGGKWLLLLLLLLHQMHPLLLLLLLLLQLLLKECSVWLLRISKIPHAAALIVLHLLLPQIKLLLIH